MDTGIVEELQAQLEEALELIKEYESVISKSTSQLSFPIAVENTEPMIITGVALASGIWKGVYYSPEELKKEATNMKEALLKLPLIVEHGKDPKYGDRPVGVHLDFYYEPTIESLIYKAKVTDPEAIKDIKSGKLFATSMKTDMKAVNIGGLTKGFKFVPLENSLTSKPACDKCLIFVKKEGNKRVLSLHKYLNSLNKLDLKRGVYIMSKNEENELEITEEQCLFIPETKEVDKVLEVEAEVMELTEALVKDGYIFSLKAGKYPKRAKKFIYYYGCPIPRYPGYGYYPYYGYYYWYPKKAKKALEIEELLDILELNPDYRSFMKTCMKEGKSMKECAAEWKKEKGAKTEEESTMEEELAKKIVCPVDGQEFPSFAAFKKHWNQEHADKYGPYKAAKKLFKSLADKKFRSAFKKIAELSEEEESTEEAKPEEKPAETKPSEEEAKEKKPAEEAKPTEKPEEEAEQVEETKPITAEELIKKARERGYKPGELFAEMELETWREG